MWQVPEKKHEIILIKKCTVNTFKLDNYVVTGECAVVNQDNFFSLSTILYRKFV